MCDKYYNKENNNNKIRGYMAAEQVIGNATENASESIAVLDALKQFESQNSPLDISPLVKAIEEADAKQAIKAASDIFSGDASNPQKMLEIYNDVLKGLDKTAASTAYSHQHTDIELRKKEERAAAAFLSTLTNIIAMNEFFDKMLTESARALERVEEIATGLSDDIDRTRQHIKENIDPADAAKHHEFLNEVEQEMNDHLEQARRAHGANIELTENIKDKIKFLPDELRDKIASTFAAAKDVHLIAITIPGSDRKVHALSKDEDGYFITTENGERVSVDAETAQKVVERNPKAKFGNEAPEKVAELEKLYNKIKEYCEENGLENELHNVEDMALAIQQNTIKIREHEQALRDLQEKLNDYKLNVLNMTSEQRNEAVKDIVAAEELVIKTKYAAEDTLQANQSIIEKGLISFDQAIIKLEAAQKQLDVIEAQTKLANDELFKYGGRHAQLQKEHGNWFTELGSNVGLDSKFGADIFIGLNSSVSWTGLDIFKSDTITAWNDSIKTEDGKHVFRDNETGELYTYDADSGERTVIDDAKERGKYYEEAYSQGKLFRNETPYSEDPNNTFDDTITAMLDADKLSDQAKTQLLDPAREAVRHAKEQAQKACDEQEGSLYEQCSAQLNALTTTQALSVPTRDTGSKLEKGLHLQNFNAQAPKTNPTSVVETYTPNNDADTNGTKTIITPVGLFGSSQ